MRQKNIEQHNTRYDWHFAMLHDLPRNQAYRQAIARVVREEAATRDEQIACIDIGAGSGFLALLTAKQPGCKSVVAYEVDRHLARVATRNVHRNGFERTVKVVAKHSTAIDMQPDSDRAALVVHEILDSDLLGEGVLPTIRHASAALLKPGYRAIPSRAVVYAALIEHPGLLTFDRLVPVDGDPVLDPTGPITRFEARSAVYDVQIDDEVRRHGGKLLSLPFKALEIDFECLPPPEGRTTSVRVPVKTSGTAHAVAFWWEAQMGGHDGSETVTNTPACFGGCGGGHWLQAASLLCVPLPLHSGNTVVVNVSQNDHGICFGVEPAAEIISPFVGLPKCPPHSMVGNAARLRLLNCRSRNDALWKAAQWIVRSARRAASLVTGPIIDVGDGPILSHLILRCLRARRHAVAGGRPMRRLRRQRLKSRSSYAQDTCAPAVICLERSAISFRASCHWMKARRADAQAKRARGARSLSAIAGAKRCRVHVVRSDAPELPCRAAGALVAEPFFRGLDADWGEAAIGCFWSQCTSLRGTLLPSGVVSPYQVEIHGEFVSCPELWGSRQPLTKLVEGVDLTHMNSLCPLPSALRCIEGQSYKSDVVAGRGLLLSLNFLRPLPRRAPWPSAVARLSRCCSTNVLRGDKAHALVVWVVWRLAPGAAWGQEPEQPGARQGLLLLRQPRTVPLEGLLVKSTFDGMRSRLSIEVLG